MVHFSVRAKITALILVFASVLAPNLKADDRTPAPRDAKVFFLDLKDGQTIPAKSTIHFGISGMEISPAAIAKPNTGHHHLLIDTGLPPLDQPIPSDFSHLHFGKGQTEAELSLTPGDHTLQLLLGDHNHIPHNPPVFSDVIHVHVDAATEETRTPAPADAKVFFIDLPDGTKLPRTSTIKFGISGMEIAPAGHAETQHRSSPSAHRRAAAAALLGDPATPITCISDTARPVRRSR